MKHRKDISKYKIRNKFTILQFMTILGLTALVVTGILAYVFW